MITQHHTWSGKHHLESRSPASAPLKRVKSELLLFDIKYDLKGQQVKAFVTKPNAHSQTSGTHTTEGEKDSCKLSTDICICANGAPEYAH